MKVAVVFWSGTGNTESMADAVWRGARSVGAESEIFTAGNFSAAMMDSYDAVAFGCPSMGSEQLEESEFAPMFEGCLDKLFGKKIALFGSYGWGDGEWMRTWSDVCKAAGAEFACDYVICNNEPDDDVLEKCRQMGVALAR